MKNKSYFCFLFIFNSVDATNIFCYGKYVNDSPEKLAYSTMKRKKVNGRVHLCLLTSKDKKGKFSSFFLFVYLFRSFSEMVSHKREYEIFRFN